jgi:hypothetical protein
LTSGQQTSIFKVVGFRIQEDIIYFEGVK